MRKKIRPARRRPQRERKPRTRKAAASFEFIGMKTPFPKILARAAFSAVFVASSIFAAPTKLVTGPDNGLSPQINTYSPTGTLTDSFFSDNVSFTGGVRVAMGDVLAGNDIITGRGPGGTAVVNVYRGSNHALVYSFLPFGPNWTVGVYVAAGDVDGDGRADIIVGTGDGPGSVPNVKVFSGADGATVLRSFSAFAPGFNGGVRVAAADINGDGVADIICGSGPGGGQVSVFSGKDLTLLKSFIPYAGYTGGIFVAGGDVNGDGVDDIITGPQTGSSTVKVFSGKDLTVLQSFTAFPGSTNGARVAAADLNGDNVADVIVSTGPGDPSRVKAMDGPRGTTLLDFSPYPGTTAGVFVGAIPHFPPQSLNISTRANVLTGDNIVIGGFIINGTDNKDVLIRGMGPSTGVPGSLADPTVELFSGNTSLAFNDNWQDTQATEIQATGIPPGDVHEAAIRRTLPPASYTAVLRGKNNTSGIGVVEVYDLNASTTNSQLANISTRGFVQTGNSVMIAGVILGGGTGANRVVVRALGPSLTQFGVTNPLSDPNLGLFNSQGTLIRGNDNWKESQETDIRGTGLQPSNDAESAILALLGGGNYTAIVAGVNNRVGTALVEIYNLQ